MEKWGIILPWVLLFAFGASAGQDPNGQNYSDFLHRNNLENWEAPLEYQKTFSYYWSGFDEECRPSEMGEWDVRKYVLQGDESRKTLRKYIHQAVERLLESLNFNNTDCDVKPTGIIAILDADDFQYSQAASSETVQFVLNMLKDYLNIMLNHVQTAYFVNTNFFAQGFLLIARPIFGEFMARVEVYGPRKSKWLPKLLKKLPSDQLPTKFGGRRNFQPLKMYG